MEKTQLTIQIRPQQPNRPSLTEKQTKRQTNKRIFRDSYFRVQEGHRNSLRLEICIN